MARYALPYLEERTPQGTKVRDPYSKLFEARIIFLSSEINEISATDAVAQLLSLNALSSEPITLYINSPGGNLTDMAMIIDTMNHIEAPVSTVGLGLVASSAAVILGSGAPGMRYALPSARILIHQPHGGSSERLQASDIEIQAREIEFLRSYMEGVLSKTTGQTLRKVKADIERDTFMSALEAKAYGLIDDVIS